MAPRNKLLFHYPWRDGNKVSLLIDGQVFFPRIEQTIAEASNLILFEMYLFESGVVATRIINALRAAADRGVTCFVLLDDFGSRRLNKEDRARLHYNNIVIRYYNPMKYGELRRAIFRDHRKLIVIDQRIVFIGGVGVTDEFNPPDQRHEWRETILEIHGPCVGDWVDLFFSTFGFVPDNVPLPPDAAAMHFEHGVFGRAISSQGWGSQEIKRALLNRISGAERDIWIATAYFVPSTKIRRQLAKAARRGIDVRLLLPGRHTDHPAVRHAGRRFYSGLLRAGVRIFEYQPRFTHSKIMVCDNWVMIGSSNFDRWNLRWNLEANQEIDNDDFSKSVKHMFERDFALSREFDYTQWRKRSWTRRVREWFWGHIDIFLQRFFDRFGRSDRPDDR